MATPRSLRILQVISDTDRRGAQVFAIDLARELAARSHNVTTVALAPGATQEPLDVAVLGTQARGPQTLLALRRRMADADITVAHGSSTLLACAIAGLGHGRPFVYRQISDSRFWAASLTRRARVRAYLRFPVRVVALSRSAADTLTDYLGVPAGRLTVIPNGVPVRPVAEHRDTDTLRAALGVPTTGFLAVYVGALAPEKAVDIAVLSLEHVPGVHLAVVGDGPERDRLERLAAERVPGRVTFVGPLADVGAAYRTADVVVLTSKSEAMPAVLIEAGLCGLPAIACSVGSVGEIVLDGTTGLLVPSGDPKALGRALERLAQDPGECERLGNAASARCNAHFTIGVVADQWEALLQSVARQP